MTYLWKHSKAFPTPFVKSKSKLRCLQALIYPEQLVEQENPRSLYASPFPYNTTLEGITAFFSNYGKVSLCTNHLRLLPVAVHQPGHDVHLSFQNTQMTVTSYVTALAHILDTMCNSCWQLPVMRLQPAGFAGFLMPAKHGRSVHKCSSVLSESVLFLDNVRACSKAGNSKFEHAVLVC